MICLTCSSGYFNTRPDPNSVLEVTYMSIITQISHSYVCERCRETRFICNYCDNEFCPQSKTHTHLLKHIGACHTQYSDQSVVGSGAILSIYCDGNLMYSGDFVNMFPQLHLLKVDTGQYKKYINDVIGKNSRNISMEYVIKETTEENANDEYKLSCAEGATLLRNFTYCCVVCGLEYDNGIPDIHMVVRHFCNCLLRMNGNIFVMLPP